MAIGRRALSKYDKKTVSLKFTLFRIAERAACKNTGPSFGIIDTVIASPSTKDWTRLGQM